MKTTYILSLLIILVISISSCKKKDDPPKNTVELENLIGNWNWYYTVTYSEEIDPNPILYADSASYTVRREFYSNNDFKEYESGELIFEGKFYVTIDNVYNEDTIFRIHYYKEDQRFVEDLFFYIHPDTIHFGYQSQNDIVFTKE